MPEAWLVAAGLAALANAGKILVAKSWAREADPRTLLFAARLAAAVLLLPLLPLRNLPWPTAPIFWAVVAATAVLTAAAGTALSWAVQRGPLSIVMPMQATLPVWMLVGLALLGHERLSLHAWAGAVLVTLSLALVLARKPPPAPDEGGSAPAEPPRADAPAPWMYGLVSLATAAVLALCTILDRTAVQAAVGGGLAYSACWNLVSTGLMAAVHTVRPARQVQPRGAIACFAGLATIAFVAQQTAVEWSQTLPGGVLYVKLVVMLHLPLVVAAGIFLWREPCGGRVMLGIVGTFVGSLMVLAGR